MFDPCNVFLAIVKNIPMLLITGFVVQGHICLFLSFLKLILKRKLTEMYLIISL